MSLYIGAYPIVSINLKICEKCQRYQVSKGHTIRYYRCKTVSGDYLWEWMASKTLPDGELEYNVEFKYPENCPYILEHLVSQ